jgi:hypothetical protein
VQHNCLSETRDCASSGFVLRAEDGTEAILVDLNSPIPPILEEMNLAFATLARWPALLVSVQNVKGQMHPFLGLNAEAVQVLK